MNKLMSLLLPFITISAFSAELTFPDFPLLASDDFACISIKEWGVNKERIYIHGKYIPRGEAGDEHCTDYHGVDPDKLHCYQVNWRGVTSGRVYRSLVMLRLIPLEESKKEIFLSENYQLKKELGMPYAMTRLSLGYYNPKYTPSGWSHGMMIFNDNGTEYEDIVACKKQPNAEPTLYFAK